MGYYVTQNNDVFNIKKEDAPAALEALKGYFRSHKASWVSEDNVLRAGDFEKAMSEARWAVNEGPSGDYDSIEFLGEKWGFDEPEVLSSIAPFVRPGSYIEFGGEAGDMWRLVFDGERCAEVTPEIIWPELPVASGTDGK